MSTLKDGPTHRRGNPDCEVGDCRIICPHTCGRHATCPARAKALGVSPEGVRIWHDASVVEERFRRAEALAAEL